MASRTRKPNSLTDKNYVEHDTVFISGTLNYTNRYQFYNAMHDLIEQKINLADRLRKQQMIQMPIIRFCLACPDQQSYPRQTERFFNMLRDAKLHDVAIESNIVGPTCMNGWVHQFMHEIATPGFRNIYEESGYLYYYPDTYDINLRKTVPSKQEIIISPELALKKNMCDAIFMRNYDIKTR